MFDKDISLKIEIKDKKLFIKNILLALGLFSLLAACIWQVATGIELKKTLAEKKAALAKAQKTSKHLKRLEQQANDLAEKEAAIQKKVPLDEKYPFALIRALTAIADEIGLQDTVFRIKEGRLSDSASAAQAQGTPVSDDGAGETVPAQETQQPAYQANPQQLTPLRFEMAFKGSYAQALALLQKIHTLERLVMVEQITIERKKEILPFQSITLQLTAYTFPKE